MSLRREEASRAFLSLSLAGSSVRGSRFGTTARPASSGLKTPRETMSNTHATSWPASIASRPRLSTSSTSPAAFSRSRTPIRGPMPWKGS
ncbi:hypothetical protein D1872_269130 [compost metagenome]